MPRNTFHPGLLCLRLPTFIITFTVKRRPHFTVYKALSMVSVPAETVPVADEQPSTSGVDDNEQARGLCAFWRLDMETVLHQQPSFGAGRVETTTAAVMSLRRASAASPARHSSSSHSNSENLWRTTSSCGVHMPLSVHTHTLAVLGRRS